MKEFLLKTVKIWLKWSIELRINSYFDIMMNMYCVAEMSTEFSMLARKPRSGWVQSSYAQDVNSDTPVVPGLPVWAASCMANWAN